MNAAPICARDKGSVMREDRYACSRCLYHYPDTQLTITTTQTAGYGTFFVKSSDYDLRGAPVSWASLPAVRHAMTMFPDAAYIWYLDQNAFIMNPNLKIEEHVMKPSRLEELMIKDHPVVPPDSIIKTFSHLKGHDVDFVLTQDKDGLSSSSFVVKNGEWAKFFIETWFDPIYRSYNFQKAEQHALVSLTKPLVEALRIRGGWNSYANT